MRANSRVLTGIGVILGVVLLLAVNILSDSVLSAARFDLTEHRLHTLSQGTRNVLAKIEEPITLRFYISQRLATRLPSVSTYASRVRDLLREYERVADGNIRLHVIEPEPFSPEEDRAVAYGIQGRAVGAGEETLYFGLVGTNALDDEEVIPWFSRERESSLEYDVTKLVHSLSDPEQSVVAVLSTLPIDGQGPQAALRGLSSPPWMVMEQMRQLFDVRVLNEHLTSVPEDVDVLMLVHPKGLSDAALYAVDQFALRGGRLLVFVDPNAEADPGRQMGGMMMPPSSRRSEADRLLEAWGVELVPDTVVGDLRLAVTVRMQRGARMVTFEYPVWINVQPEHFDENDVVTGSLGNLAFGTPGALRPLDGSSTDFTPLVWTTDGAATFTEEQVTALEDPQSLLRGYEPAGKELILAARVTGPVRTAFPDGPPPPEQETPEGEGRDGERESDEPAGERRAHLSESSAALNLIVVADTDLLQDRFWVSVEEVLGSRFAVPNAANGTLVVNALDNLTGSGDLISVRNRGSFVRPFERVNELRQRAELRYREKEEELIRRLEETERKLDELEEGRRGEEPLLLTPEQQQELVRFRQERLRVRNDLRDVRHELRASIERLETRLKVLNIGLMPFLVGLAGVAVGAWRVRRRRASVRAASPRREEAR